ncbi:neuron navigator 3-like isoform X4 [Ornithodoros turicata]|uniref:neuron navigator 3-like isoform X4 n=1 Tax=Ornithodoros turicata TaxID=34597 RepID=UPI00313A3699
MAAMACIRRNDDASDDGSVDNVKAAPVQQPKSIVQIYTDWANHYLERSRYKRYIQDLQTDVCDGVLLADVIDAVAGAKVPDIIRKPKTNTSMVDNITACLSCLANLGVSTDGVTAKDIREGNLKAILGLFFSLSRYKQAQKAASSPPSQSATNGHPPPSFAPQGTLRGSSKGAMPTATPNDNHSKLPSLHPAKVNGRAKDALTAIPCPMGSIPRRPANAATNHHHPNNNMCNIVTTDSKGGNVKSPPASTVVMVANTGVSGIAPPKTATNTSRAGSPHTGSFIPQPKSSVVTRDRNTSDRSRPSSTASSSSVSHLPAKGSIVGTTQSSSRQNGHAGKAPLTNGGGSACINNNNSMLDKFKLFNSKDKNATNDKNRASTVSKRPSSSSGFSSARSERSDSSVSLCGDTISTSTPTEAGHGTSKASAGHCNGTANGSATSSSSSPKVAVKNFAKKTFGRATGKHPTSKASSASREHLDAPDHNKSGLPRSSPSADTLSGLAKRSPPQSGIQRPSSTGHELNGHIPSGQVVQKAQSPANISPPSKDDDNVDMNSSMQGPGSGIPKPTAAVKGTSKPSKEERNSASSPPPHLEKENLDINQSTDAVLAKSSSAKELGLEGGTKTSTLPKNERTKKVQQNNPSIAMVSPIMSSQHGKELTNEELVEASVSTNQSKEAATLVGAVDTTVKSVPAEAKTITKSNIPEGDEAEDSVSSVPPMQPLNRVSPYYSRVASRIHAGQLPVGRMPACLRLQTDVQRVAKHLMAASQDMARLYGVQRVGRPDYVEAGYVSDGDILRAGFPSREDPSSGYVSEGGASLYARRAAAAARCRDPKLINVLQDDSDPSSGTSTLVPSHRIGFDDSSSISSGISDTFAELSTNDNLTDSSLSSDPYGCLKRHHPGAPLSHTSNKPATARKPDQASTSGLTSSPLPTSSRSRNANVKKTDSSMQTESSALQQGVSASWKKYFQEQQQLKTNSSESLKSKDSKRPFSKKSAPPQDSNKHDGHKKSSSKSGSSLKSSDDSKLRGYVECDGGSGRSSPGKDGSGMSRKSSSRPANPACVVAKRPSSSASNSSGKTSKSKRDASEYEHHGTPTSSLTRSGELPRTSKSSLERKSKVSGSTQTGTHEAFLSVHSDSEYSSLGRAAGKHAKQYLTAGAMGAAGLGSVRERIYGTRSLLNGSPPSYVSNADYVMLSGFHHGSARDRPRLSVPSSKGGSESDNYVMIDHGEVSSPYAWLRHSPTPGSMTSAPLGRAFGGMGIAEADSMESLSSTASSAHGQHHPHMVPSFLPKTLASTLTPSRLFLYQREISGTATCPGRISRSSSMRSTQSEGLEARSLMQRSHHETSSSTPADHHHPSCPPSPTRSMGQGTSRYLYTSSPLHSSHGPRNSMPMSHYMGGLLSKMNTKDDEAHGSSASLVSTTSSLYSTTEEKQAHEIRKLRKELEQAHEKVATLTSQLTTNAHMVAAFEQSLSNMTSRLQHLTATAEQKDSELSELRGTVEALKKQSAEAGLTKMALQSMAAVQRSMGNNSTCPTTTPTAANLVRRHTFNTPKDAAALQDHRMSRQLSADSMSSVNSASSACSNSSLKNGSCTKKEKKKKGWLRSSFSKAFSRSKKNRNGSVSDVEDLRAFQSDSSVPNSPLLGIGGNHVHLNGITCNGGMKTSHSSSALNETEEDNPEAVRDLRKQLREKDMVLTDIRLEALSSAHQLDSLKETLGKMRNEMMNLKQDNDRLQRLVHSKSLGSSQSSLPRKSSVESINRRLSASESTTSTNLDIIAMDGNTDADGKRVSVMAYLGGHGDITKFISKAEAPGEVYLGSILVSGKTKWDNLDHLVRKCFKEYVSRVDPSSNLGLNSESVLCYHIGEVVRSKEIELPELLPCGYLVGETLKIQVVLKGTKQNAVDGMALETLIPKSIVQRYISLLSEHRRIILCGPSGTGKTFLGQKLAEYLVLKSGKDVAAGSIATFSVDHKSAKELRQYLSNIAEQCESSNAGDLPTVIILDNLHHVGSLGEVFNGFLSAKYQKCPYIIGTMNQATCSTTNLQLHHNFRWVLCANHMEPVKGFLGRYLQRRLIEEEVRLSAQQPSLAKVINWMPKVWLHLNKFLETHSSSDVTIGPRLFLSCPMDVPGSQVWFTDLWNYSIVPYLLEAVREGLQLYGRRAPWEDPAEWVLQTYPWSSSGDGPQLLRLRPEDVGYDASAGAKAPAEQSEAEADPLLNMLMRLQEAASYSSPQGNDGESAGSDDHISASFEGAM